MFCSGIKGLLVVEIFQLAFFHPLLLRLFDSRRLLHCLSISVGEFVLIFGMFLVQTFRCTIFGSCILRYIKRDD